MNDQSKNQQDNAPEAVQLPLAELMRIRREKIAEMNKKNLSAYPYRFDRTHLISEVLKSFDSFAEKETVVRIAGRVMLKRKMGKSFFAHMRDSSEQIQIYLKFDIVGEEHFALFDSIDLGDIIGCEGTLFVTKTGERTVRVTKFELLTKALHPLPDKHAGLTDKETRYRRRYADLIVNPEVREVFRKRTAIIQAVR